MNYNKLIRDNIPEHLDNKGVEYTSHIADEKECWEKLQDKLQEEVAETISEMKLENNKTITEELADVLEVIHAIANYKNIKLEDIEHIRKLKKEEKWGFDQRIILDKTQE